MKAFKHSLIVLSVLGSLSLFSCQIQDSSHKNLDKDAAGLDVPGPDSGDLDPGDRNGRVGDELIVPEDTNPEDIVDFARISKDILEPHCINCHSGTHRAYENFNVVKASIRSIRARIVTSNVGRRMPQARPALSKDLVDLLDEWIAAGTPKTVVIRKPQPTDPGDNIGDDNNKPDPIEDGLNPEPTPEPVPTVGFFEIREKIIKPHCAQCHSQFLNFNPVKKQIGSILGTVLSDRMPFARSSSEKVIPLKPELKELLNTWVSEGAPQFPGGPIDPMPEEPLKPTWISLRDKVLGPKCILCHNKFGPRAPTDMSTHLALRQWAKKQPDLFNYKDPEESHFVGSMRGRVDDDEFFFDPMPFNNPNDDVQGELDPVSSEEIEVIKEWIRRKLPYDDQDTP